MDGSLIIAALIAAPLCYLFLRWYLPRLPKRKTWREQVDEGRNAARARSEQIAEQSRQYQEIQKAKREGRQSGQDNN